MIRKVLALVPPEFSAYRTRLIAVIVLQALCQAAAYLLLVPLLEALFDRRLGAAWLWAAVTLIAVAGVAASATCRRRSVFVSRSACSTGCRPGSVITSAAFRWGGSRLTTAVRFRGRSSRTCAKSKVSSHI